MPKIIKQTPTKVTSAKASGSAWDMMPTGLHLLLYGESGTGKTRVWSTFPKPILALICSGGKRPGELRSIDTPENRQSITAEIVNTLDDLYRNLDRIDQFQTVVVDHATGLSDLILFKEILGLDEIPEQKGWGTASQQQYGELGAKLKTVLARILGHKENVVIIAHQRDYDPKEGSEIQIAHVRGRYDTLGGRLAGRGRELHWTDDEAGEIKTISQNNWGRGYHSGREDRQDRICLTCRSLGYVQDKVPSSPWT